MNSRQIDISEIKIGTRHRKDQGDLQALAASIEKVGQLQAIGVTPEMDLIFGQRRVLACRDILRRKQITARVLNIPSIVLGEYHENFGRKTFSPSELVAIVETMRGYSHGGDRRSDQSRNSDDDLLTADEAATLVGLGRDTYFRAHKVVEKGIPELVEAMDSEKLSIFAASELADADPDDQRSLIAAANEERWTARTIRKQLRQAQRLRDRQAKLAKGVEAAALPESVRLYHCRFQELEEIHGIKEGSANLVLTDIPYDQGFLPHVGDLGKFAARVLMDGGLLVMYCGQYWLPEVMRPLGEHLAYRWVSASVWDGDANLIHPLDLTSQWKPILVYSKGPWRKRGRWGDVFRVPSKEKGWHDWQQPIVETERLVRYFSEPGDFVIDPCAGGFSTAAACFRWNRQFAGCDIDESSVTLGHQRMAEEVADRKLLLEELAVWIEDAPSMGDDQRSVEEMWQLCKLDPEYLAVNLHLLPESHRILWDQLGKKRRRPTP